MHFRMEIFLCSMDSRPCGALDLFWDGWLFRLLGPSCPEGRSPPSTSASLLQMNMKTIFFIKYRNS